MVGGFSRRGICLLFTDEASVFAFVFGNSGCGRNEGFGVAGLNKAFYSLHLTTLELDLERVSEYRAKEVGSRP